MILTYDQLSQELSSALSVRTDHIDFEVVSRRVAAEKRDIQQLFSEHTYCTYIEMPQKLGKQTLGAV